MKNVLFLLNHAGKAGTETYVLSLIENIKGIKPFFAYNEEGLLAERVREKKIPVFKINLNSRFDFKAAKEIAKICKENNIDIIHTHYLREHYLALLSKLFYNKVKVVYTSHFVMKNDFATKISNKLLSPLMDDLISVCTIGKEYLAKNGNPRDKITVIFNGIEPENFIKTPSDKIRKQYNIASEEVVMFCASRFAHDKGHKFLIQAVNLLKNKTNIAWKLILAGDGELLPTIKEDVKKYYLEENVIFMGFTKNIKDVFFESDIYINSSEHEALSFLIIEAMASGLPVIATDMGGNSDIICDATNAGMLVTYNDPESLCNAMLKLIEDENLRKTYAENAVKAANGRFNVKKMLKDVETIYFKEEKI